MQCLHNDEEPEIIINTKKKGGGAFFQRYNDYLSISPRSPHRRGIKLKSLWLLRVELSKYLSFVKIEATSSSESAFLLLGDN